MGLFKSDVKSDIKAEFLKSISMGLTRKSITSCSRWAEKYRVMSHLNMHVPWKFTDFPWLRGMHDSKAKRNIGQKSAQMGFTETVLNIAFYHIDVKGIDCLYVLPSKTPDASDFSASRFDPALDMSQHLMHLFSDVKNVGHKRAGSANLYIRGSNSRGGLKSIPVGLVILDELNEMPARNIPLALERTSGQIEKLDWLISTPTVEDVGINKYYKNSTQNHFYFKCPSCSRFIELTFPDSMEIHGESPIDPRIRDSVLICNKCKAKLPHENKAEWLADSRWIESFTDRDDAGWHISQLYSTRVSPPEIAKAYFNSLRDETDEQEFYNSKLGVTHEIAGSRISEGQIESVKGTYIRQKSNDYGLVTMGVDVNYPFLNFEIDKWDVPSGISITDLNNNSRPHVINYGKLNDMEELDELMRDFKVSFCVIDAQPERRKAYEFATRFWGHVRLIFYIGSIVGKQIKITDDGEPKVTVDRTSWLDVSLGRFKNGSITLPADTDYEYSDQIQALIRTYRRDENGNPVAEYVSTKADHYGHSRNYAEIALPLAYSVSKSRSIQNIM
jgi:hypothetical protein